MRPLSLTSVPSPDGPVDSDASEPIAIVGLAAHLPQQATSTERLWELLLQARSTWSTIPTERFNADAFYHPDPEHGGAFHVQGGHYLSEDPALFDSSFFNITRNELLTLDPQQRLVLENVYHALENAGIPMANVVGSNTSVFVSGFNHDYLGILNSDPESNIKYKPTGVTNALLSNRVSWFFDLNGPSMTIDTACSSGLVALHLAVQSLRAKETNMAIVSGVSVLENPVEFIGMSHHGLLGPQGRSFSFDSRAEGYARGEGVGTIIVKTLEAAIRDGDSIRAVIRETGVNQDGRTPGITVPRGDAQEKLIREVYERAGLDLQHTGFVEAHGTGTSIGDPIEAGALARAFGGRRGAPLYIGAIKSSIGHLEGGSGVASIIKSVLILESAIIPANYDMKHVNPSIPTADGKIKFPTANLPWPSSGLRRASVNSFGIGGTNSHCILDDAYHYLTVRHLVASHCTAATVPTVQKIRTLCRALPGKKIGTEKTILDSSDDSDTPGGGDPFAGTPTSEGFCESPQLGLISYTNLIDQPKLFLLSAFDEDGVKRNAFALASYLEDQVCKKKIHDDFLDDLSFTLSKKRSLFPWKSFVMASSIKELAWNLSESNFVRPSKTTSEPELQFVFTGQGAQYRTMGRELMIFPAFEKSVEKASDYIRRLGSPWSLLDEFRAEGEPSRVDLPEIAHPLCTILQIALVDLLASWKIFPTGVVGHSSGEIAAAYCAGRLSRKAAWRVAYYRGYTSSKQLSANGAMMAVGLSASQLEGYIKRVRDTTCGELIIACYNSPKNNTVSGDEAMIDNLKKLLDADGAFSRKLNVKNAYHSAHMKTISKEYLRLMGALPGGKRLAAPHQVTMFSTVTGHEVEEELLPSQYWVDNMISPVLFTDGLIEMTSRPKSGLGATASGPLHLLIEIGPHSTLQSAIKEILAAKEPDLNFKYLPVLKKTDHNLRALLTTAGFLASSGLDVDLHHINQASKPEGRWPPRLLIDLPPYSFKHTEKILFESRLSKNLRTRKYPRHDLFGAPITDWNPSAPRWRHFVRLNENPWLRDHMVTGNYVYPGVGYLIMAIEASRQLAGQSNITGFQLRRVNIKRALIIPDTPEGIEVSLSMATLEDPSSGSRIWRCFQITSYNASSQEWTEHCTGSITVNYESSPDPVDNGRELEEERQAWKADLATANEACNKSIDFKSTYHNLQTSGLRFGDLFRNLADVRASGCRLGKVVGSVTIPDIAQSMPKQFMHSHLIHPATMDSMIHLMIAAVQDLTDGSTLDQIRLPTFIRDVWISANLPARPSDKFNGYATVLSTQSGKFEGHIQMLSADTVTQCIRMEGIELTPLESGLAGNDERKLCSTIAYKPDVNFLDSFSAKLAHLDPTNEVKERYWIQRFQLGVMIYVTDALAACEEIDVKDLDLHMQRFLHWMRHMRDKLVQDDIIHLPYSEFQLTAQNEALKKAIDKEIESHSAEGAITARMGRNILQVLKGQIDPLHLMFGKDDVMEQVYKEGLHRQNLSKHLQSHLSLLRHQYSGLRILEIGGGTGSLTAEVLAGLCPDPTKSKESIARYTFTDISSGFFEKANQRFQSWSDIMEFKLFDIGRSAIEQELQLETYDLIFAGNVIHATAHLQDVLRNLRSLLKPGGRLIMQEGIRQDFLWYSIVFGQLPGWWLGDEPCRQWCPYISTDKWNGLLVKAGFSGVDIEYPSSEVPDLSWQSILVASNPPAIQHQGPLTKNALIVTTGRSHSFRHLKLYLRNIGYDNISVSHPSKLGDYVLSDMHCISLIDWECRYLAEMTEGQYNDLKLLLNEAKGLLWITESPETNPYGNMSMGLLRAVRWERDSDGSNIVTLTTKRRGSVKLRDLSTAICKIVKHQFWDRTENDRHAEYLLQDRILHIGQLREWTDADQFLGTRSSRLYPKLQRMDTVGYPIELQQTTSGNKAYHWLADIKHENPLADNEVEIEVRAVGLSSDHSDNYLSTEAAGTVTKIGSKVKTVRPGERVAYVSAPGHGYRCRTHDRVNHLLVSKIPDHISHEIAAQITSAFAISIQAMYARLSAEDRILIHNGAMAIGQAAIQCAQMSGAQIYTTVSSTEDRDLLISEHGIPKEHIFSSRDLKFAKGIMRCTGGRGVDIIFNTMTGEALQATLACLAPHGTFIDIAQGSGKSNSVVDLIHPSQKNVSIHKIDLFAMAESRPAIVRSLLDEAFKLYTDGKIGQIRRSTVLNFSQIKEGIRAVQSGRSAKVVLHFDPSDVVSVVPQPTTPYQFDSDATYVLAGGYGGLGRSIARWMASRGARNLILLSRSLPSSPKKQEMVRHLEEIGCRIISRVCDISQISTLRELFGGQFSDLPPIKGCIQASMVLRDGAFSGMSFEDWQAATMPKVQGSWNLHEVLPTNMDFFVMLSSVAGIFGNRGQANYAAGNTFQDALAAYRVSRNMKASSISLGSVSNVGWVAENRSSIRTNTATLFELLREDEVHAAIEFCIISQQSCSQANPTQCSQLVLGLPTAEMCRQNGVPSPTYLDYSMFTHFRNIVTLHDQDSLEQKPVSVAAQLVAASGLEAAVAVVSNGIIQRLSSLLAVPSSEIDAHRFGFGNIDSLVAIEFRSWIVKELQADVSLLDIMGAENIPALSKKVASHSRLVAGPK